MVGLFPSVHLNFFYTFLCNVKDLISKVLFNGCLLAAAFLRCIASVYFPMFRLFHGALFVLVKTIYVIATRTPDAIVGKTNVNSI